MNMQNELAAAMTRRQAVTSLALMPFSPPLCLAEEHVHTLSASKYDLFLQEIGARAYSQIVDPESLEVVPAFRGIRTEELQLDTTIRMAEASLAGDARDMGEAIRYWEYVARCQKTSKHRESKIATICKQMRLAFPGEKRVSKLSDLLREKSQ